MMIEIKVSSVLHGKVPPSDKNLNGDKWEVPDETEVADVLEMLNLTGIPAILILNTKRPIAMLTTCPWCGWDQPVPPTLARVHVISPF